MSAKMEDLQEFYDLTLENASKPMNVKAEATQCLAKKWEEHEVLPAPNATRYMHLAQSRIVPSHEPLNKDITTVIIEREPNSGLGLSISGGTDNPHFVGDYGIFVARIIPGSAAEKCGRIHVGDQILSVNGISLEAVTHAECVQVLKKSGTRVEIVACHLHQSFNFESMDGLENGQDVGMLPSTEARIRYIEVVLHKSEESGLGFVLAGGCDNQHIPGDSGIFVTKIIPDSPAHRDGTISVGDRLVEVDGHSLQDIEHLRAVSLLQATQNRVLFKIEKNAYQRATPFYSSKAESFERDNSDKLMPRNVFLHRPEGASLGLRIACGNKPPGVFISGITSDGMADMSGALQIGDEILEVNGKDVRGWSQPQVAQVLKTYGTTVSLKVVYRPEVIKGITANQTHRQTPVIQQQQFGSNGHACPVVILGPLKEDVGAMLIKEFPNEFGGSVPHTTRQPRKGEVNGKDYHFVASVDEMKKNIQADLFIEFGIYKGHLYGTSIQAVRDVLEQKKHCVLAVGSQSVGRLVRADFMPMVFCLRPSDYTVVVNAHEYHSTSARMTDHEAQQLIDRGLSIENDMGKILTAVVEGRSLEELYKNVIEAIHFAKRAWMSSDGQS